MNTETRRRIPAKTMILGALMLVFAASLLTITAKPASAGTSFSIGIGGPGYSIGYRTWSGGGYRLWHPGYYNHWHHWHEGYWSGPVVYQPAYGYPVYGYGYGAPHYYHRQVIVHNYYHSGGVWHGGGYAHGGDYGHGGGFSHGGGGYDHHH